MLGAIAALLMPIWLIQAKPAHASANDFTVSSFTADYYLGRDSNQASQMKVDEKIVAEFPNFDQNHGILRAIPQTYKGHSLHLAIQKVTDGNGALLHYSSSTANGNLVLKIGDAKTYVHGTQAYDIVYTLHDVTTAYSDHDELYWDVNGDQWPQTFGSVVAHVHIPTDLADRWQSGGRCFVGQYGVAAEQCQMTSSTEAGGKVETITSSRPLQSHETLTYVMGFSQATFGTYHRSTSEIVRDIALVVGFGVLPPLVATGVMFTRWRRQGKDPKGRGTIVPEYLPPTATSVLGSGVVLKEKLLPAAITAQVIDLAVRHYLKIYEVTVDRKIRADYTQYEIELVRSPQDLRTEELEVVHILFGDHPSVGARVQLEKLKASLSTKVRALGKMVSARVAAEGLFKGDPARAARPYTTVGSVLIVAGFFVLPYSLGLVLAGVIVLAFGHAMPVRTPKGVTLREYLLGLKMYMQVAEAERIKILQSPHGELTEKIDVSDKTQLVKLYERLLPYAMLFGIEQDWAKEFASLYESPPDWYVGSSTFNAVWFATSLTSFSASSAKSFMPPSSSGGSGLGGGGFAGGGGGGGGGGGW